MMAMTSSEATAAAGVYSFEQLEAGALIHSRLDGAALAAVSDEGAAEERAREDARRAAAAEGRAAGLAEFREQAAPLLAALGEALAGIDALRSEVAEQLERDAIELAVQLAERIVAGTLEVAPERILDVVRGALRRIADRRRIVVVVNPADAPLINEQLETLRAELGGIEEATVQADRRVARGGALVQTSDGALDVQVESQLDRVRAVVAEEFARR
jgi:flagellar assembly protein FliH